MGRENEYHFISAVFNFILCDKVSKGSAVVAILKISQIIKLHISKVFSPTEKSVSMYSAFLKFYF